MILYCGTLVVRKVNTLIWLSRQSTSLVRTRSRVRIPLSAPEKERHSTRSAVSFYVCCRAGFDAKWGPRNLRFWGEDKRGVISVRAPFGVLFYLKILPDLIVASHIPKTDFLIPCFWVSICASIIFSQNPDYFLEGVAKSCILGYIYIKLKRLISAFVYKIFILEMIK